MDIRRIINRNHKLIWKIATIIIFVLFIIKALNSYYENEEKQKLQELESSLNAEKNQSINKEEIPEDYYGTESDSIDKTMRSFVKYCNNKEYENAYQMLTEECKTAMFPTVEEFARIYVNNIYNIERDYELIQWTTEENREVYKVNLYGNILSTGDINNYTQEYYTFVKKNGNYKLNINNYIYGEDKNIQISEKNIKVKIGHVDVYEEYEEVNLTIKNHSSKTICLTGNKYYKNIYLQKSENTTYSSLNSKFDNEEIIMKPGSTQSFKVRFNKTYNTSSKANYLILSDVILDYENYLNSDNKTEYLNRTQIKIRYY